VVNLKKKFYFPKEKKKETIGIVEVFLKDKRINFDFLKIVETLTLEELIYIKFELATQYLHGRFPPTFFIRHMYFIVLKIIFDFVETYSTNVFDASYFLGITPKKFGSIASFLKIELGQVEEIGESVEQF
jgi:hypothetical protein